MLDPVLSGKSEQDGGDSEFVANIAAKNLPSLIFRMNKHDILSTRRYESVKYCFSSTLRGR